MLMMVVKVICRDGDDDDALYCSDDVNGDNYGCFWLG